MGRTFKNSAATGLVLLLFIIACRQFRALADFYALSLYPVISSALSYLASAVSFSLIEIAILVLIIAIISIIIIARKRHWGFFRTLCYEANLILWIYVWMYMAWGINYFRSSIFTRAQVQPAAYEAESFKKFLYDYTDKINECYTIVGDIDKENLESYTKDYYKNVDPKFGLSTPKTYQHPKKQIFSFLQSGVGVTGYIGPFLDETHVNPDVLNENYPFTYTHEYSHLLGISNEAEANYWAYKVCTSSPDKEIRYSGYFGILPYVWSNARAFLSEEEFTQWFETLRPEVQENLFSNQDYWRGKRMKVLDNIQSYLYNLFLKSNNIPSGTKNYSEVLLIILSLDN